MRGGNIKKKKKNRKMGIYFDLNRETLTDTLILYTPKIYYFLLGAMGALYAMHYRGKMGDAWMKMGVSLITTMRHSVI